MKNKRRTLGIVAAALLALGGTVSLVAYVSSAKDSAIAQERLVDVYVVDRFVPQGADAEAIRSSLTVEQVPARLEQVGAITRIDAIDADAVAAADLQPGDQLLDARLTERDVVADEVEGKVQVSALLDAHRAVGGALRTGDLVGVYVSFEPFEVADAPFPGSESSDQTEPVALQTDAADPGDAAPDADVDPGPEPGLDAGTAVPGSASTPNVTRFEFHHVLVTDVQTINPPVTRADEPESTDDPEIEQVTGTQYVVTIALSPEESERFVFANEFGTVWLSLDPATVEDDGTRRVELGDVYEVVR
ncbi:hypothetical protein [Ilumatobacter sp.]|uniref:hypothetical protein n=1 Tax=Ilumatobacter sp. TaxID=1967498 RepID=UPI003B52E89E